MNNISKLAWTAVAVIVLVTGCSSSGSKSASSQTPRTAADQAYLDQVHRDIGRHNSDAQVLKFGQDVCAVIAGDVAVGASSDTITTDEINTGMRDGITGIGLMTGAAEKNLCPQYVGKD